MTFALGAFYADPKLKRVELFSDICANTKSEIVRLSSVAQRFLDKFTIRGIHSEILQNGAVMDTSLVSKNIVASVFGELASKLALVDDPAISSDIQAIEARAELIKDPAKLKALEKSSNAFYEMITNVSLYLLARFLFFGFKVKRPLTA